MRIIRRTGGIIAALLAVLLLAACNEPVPDQDLQAAKRAIAAAEAAKADKYDPDNMQSARSAYKKALQLVVKEQNGQARKKAVQAKNKADAATRKAQQQSAKYSISDAADAIRKAENNRAGFLSGSLLARAKKKLEDAKKNFQQKNWLNALADAENSKEAAGKAYDKAVQRMNNLKKMVRDADFAVKQADGNSVVHQYAESELTNAQTYLKTALDEKKKVDDYETLFPGSYEVRNQQAKNAFEKAYNAAKKSRDLAVDAIRLALMRQREAMRKKAQSKLTEAEKLLKKIEELKKKGLIKQHMLPSPPPVNSSNTASIINNSAANSSDDTNSSAKSIDTDSSTNNNAAAVNGKSKYQLALDALKRAQSTYNGESYSNSIKNSEEAIRLAKLLLDQLRKKKYYTVRLIPAARDCLWRIANYRFIYGQAALWPKIWKANKHLIVDPDLIYPGQKFVIPPKE